jgi:apolipoprotein N-acyltransferase
VRRHELDVVSLVFGLFFVGAAAVWGLSSVPGHPVRGWALPVLLIAVGAVSLLTSLVARHARTGEPAEENPTPPTDLD